MSSVRVYSGVAETIHLTMPKVTPTTSPKGQHSLIPFLPSMTELIAALVSVAVAIAFTRVWKPGGDSEVVARIGRPVDPELETETAKTEAADTSNLTGNKIFMALVPYLMVIVVFGIAAIPAVKDFFVSLDGSGKTGWARFQWPGLSEMLSASGAPASHQTFAFPWASTPGILLALVAILTALVYKVSMKDAFKELWVNVKKMKFAMLTIGAVVALAYVMGDSGQTLALGMFIAGAGESLEKAAETEGDQQTEHARIVADQEEGVAQVLKPARDHGHLVHPDGHQQDPHDREQAVDESLEA